MTRTLSIVTVALIGLSAVAPLVAAQSLGTLEPQPGACLDAPAKVAPKPAPDLGAGMCAAGNTADDGPEVHR